MTEFSTGLPVETSMNVDNGMAFARFESVCGIATTVQTNYPQGGDAGHGGLTTIRFAPESFSIECEQDEHDNVTLLIGGDAEVAMLPGILRTLAQQLEVLIRLRHERAEINARVEQHRNDFKLKPQSEPQAVALTPREALAKLGLI